MQIDLITITLPFFFILVVVYGALEVSGIFKKRSIKALVSVLIAIFTVTNETVIFIINSYLPYTAFFFIVFFFLGFLYTIIKRGERGDPVLLAIIFSLILIFLVSEGYNIIKSILPSHISLENFLTILGLMVIIFILLAVYRAKS